MGGYHPGPQTAGIGARAGIAQPRGASEVQEQSVRLESSIQYAMGRIQELAARMDTILRPLLPTNEPVSKAPTPQTGHANFLADQANKIVLINDALDSLLNRIEL